MTPLIEEARRLVAAVSADGQVAEQPAGSSAKLPFKQQHGVWFFDLPPDTPQVTARQVQWLLNESA